MATEKIQIFDTTLRDGEQVPGCKLNKTQKMHIAEKLDELGVDVIETDFPISSPGDFEAVEAILKNTLALRILGIISANCLNKTWKFSIMKI